MNTTIRGHNLRVTVAIALLAVMVLLTVVLVNTLRPVPTTSDRSDRNDSPAIPIHAMSADGKRVSSIPQNPGFERHAEVVERLGDGSLQQG